MGLLPGGNIGMLSRQLAIAARHCRSNFFARLASRVQFAVAGSAICRRRQHTSGEKAGGRCGEEEEPRLAAREISRLSDDFAPASITDQMRELLDLTRRLIGIAREPRGLRPFERLRG